MHTDATTENEAHAPSADDGAGADYGAVRTAVHDDDSDAAATYDDDAAADDDATPSTRMLVLAIKTMMRAPMPVQDGTRDDTPTSDDAFDSSDDLVDKGVAARAEMLAERAAAWRPDVLGQYGAKRALRILTLEAPHTHEAWRYLHFVEANAVGDDDATVTLPRRKRILQRLQRAAISHGRMTVGPASESARGVASYNGATADPAATRHRIVKLLAGGWAVVRDTPHTHTLYDDAAIAAMEAEAAELLPTLPSQHRYDWRPLPPDAEQARAARAARRLQSGMHPYEVAMLHEEDLALGIVENLYYCARWKWDALVTSAFKYTLTSDQGCVEVKEKVRTCPNKQHAMDIGLTDDDLEELRLRGVDTGAAAWIEDIAKRERGNASFDWGLKSVWEVSATLAQWAQRDAAVRADRIKDRFFLSYLETRLHKDIREAEKRADGPQRVADLRARYEEAKAQFLDEAGARAERARAASAAQAERLAARRQAQEAAREADVTEWMRVDEAATLASHARAKRARHAYQS